jgi:hypothetical protein
MAISPLIFTWDNLELQLQSALGKGYCFKTISEWYTSQSEGRLDGDLNFVLRVDIDLYPEKIIPLQSLLSRLGIKATFFVRLHSPSYNPLSFASLNLIHDLVQEGHEIGLHHEAIDYKQMVSWQNGNPLSRQLSLFESLFGFRPNGVAGHGGSTGLNNQDIFFGSTASDFNLLYEAYDSSTTGIFSQSRFVSDSLWTEWKAYDNGSLRIGDKRTLQMHIEEMPANLYVLIHPDTFYFSYPYENFR